jgi:hypothetical protein
MRDFITSLKIMPAIIGAWILFLAACDSSTPPPSPPASATTPSEDEEFSSKTVSKTEELDEPKEDDEEEDEKASEFNFGGADLGEKEVVDAVKKCVDAGKFFNRFDSDEAVGTCTKLSLAKVDCESKGLKKVLSDKQLEQFQKAMSDDSSSGYKGWTIDQCLDCEKDSDEDLCKNSSGKEQVGTKVFFVKEVDTVLSGKSMVLPVRPGESKD